MTINIQRFINNAEETLLFIKVYNKDNQKTKDYENKINNKCMQIMDKVMFEGLDLDSAIKEIENI